MFTLRLDSTKQMSKREIDPRVSRSRSLLGWLIGCYAFLYAPIGFLVSLSFNDSRLVTAWAGFSFRWYVALWHDRPLIAATLLSLRIAAASATLALIVGTLAGYALARFGRFPTRNAFAAALAAPLVLPEVITGLSLLLLFVALRQTIGWPAGRGAGTVTLAHASVSVAYVAAVVRARLAGTPADLEDAAMDLYAPPWQAFMRITLPLMAPGMISGWLLAFTLSLDDVVVASFTSGPGASTLPMVVFSSIKLGPTPELYALATIIVAAVAAILLAVWRAQRGFAAVTIAPAPPLR
jgi:putrescine transport system permease protein